MTAYFADSQRIGTAVAAVARLSTTDSRRQPNAATMRWRVTTLPSTPLPVPGVGRARWLVELIRCRAGESAHFELEACDAKGRLALPSELAHRPASGRAGAHLEGEAHARMRVVGTEGNHCRGISTKPMLTRCLTAFLTTVSGSLVFRHSASRKLSWPLSLISTIAARTANSAVVKSSHSPSAMAWSAWHEPTGVILS